MFGSIRPPRPRLTGRIFVFALADVFGLTCIALGGLWLATGQNVLITSFPKNVAEAVAAIAGGLAVMIWAVAHVLKEIAKQGPELQARYDAMLKERQSSR